MSDTIARILRPFAAFLLLAAMTTVAPLFVYVDSVVIGNGASEYVYVFYGSCQLMRDR